MSSAELQNIREQLLHLSKRLNGEVTSLAREALQASGGATGGLSGTPLHLADLGTDHYEQELSLGFLENKQRTLEEIAEALARFDEGTFGRCERCHREIPLERLKVVPFTRHCINCARKVEKEETAQDALAH